LRCIKETISIDKKQSFIIKTKQTSIVSHPCKDMKVFNLSPLVVVVAFATTILAATIPTPDCIAACNTAEKECLARKIKGQ
jgi:hypothetical protein